MRKSHRDAASELQEVAARYRWHVTLEGNAIRLTKEVFQNKRQIIFSVLLIRTGEGYDIQPFTYEFKSKISFFDYATPENRQMRNKVAFEQFFGLMRRANMWDIISNRDTFLRINDNCKRVRRHRDEVQASLRKMTSIFDIIRKRKSPRKHANIRKFAA